MPLPPSPGGGKPPPADDDALLIAIILPWVAAMAFAIALGLGHAPQGPNPALQGESPGSITSILGRGK